MALFSNEEGSVTVFDYGDPIISCSPGSCTGSLGKEDFNQGTLGSQLQRIIRFGVTLEATITPFPREAHVQQFSYDLEGRLWKIEGPLADQLVTLEYWDDLAPIHKQGRLKNRKVRVTTTSELVTTFNDYDMFGNPLSVTFTRLPKNNPTEADETWSLSYYENGRLETIQNPNGQTWTYNYTPAGTIESIVSPEGNTTKSSYDVNGLLAAVGRYPSSSSSAVWDETELSYDSRGNTTKIEYKKNAVTKLRSTYGYDDRDRLAWEGIWRNGPSVPHYYKVYGYNAGWQIASVTDANHAIDPEDIANANLQYDYHPSGELLSVKRKVSNNFEMESRFASDNRGNINSTLDSETRLSIYLHDDFDRLVMTGGPAPVAYLYDAANRLVNRYEIIHMGSYNSDVPIAADEEIVYQYDLANRLIAKNGNGLQWNAVFDAAPQTVTKCFGGGTISLENRGWRLARVTRNDTELAFGYDVSGRLLHEARQAPGKNCYHVFSRTYTDNGQLATLTYPSGRIVEYIYPESSLIGDVDRPIQLKMMLGTIETILLDGIVYQAGKPHQWTDSSGLKTTVTWNLDGTVAERIVENCPEGSCSTPPSIFFNWNVSDRDGVGNVTEIISMYPGGLLPVETAFSYTEQYFLESRTQLCLLCKNLFFEYTNSGELSYEHSSAFVLFSDSSRDFSYNDFLIDRIDITTGATAVERFIQYNHAPGDTRIASKLMMESPMFPEKWSARYTVDGFLDRLHHESNFDFDTGVAQTNDYRYYTYDGLDRRSLRSTTASGVARTREFWNDNKIFSEIDIKNRRISKIKSILSSGLEWSGKYRDYIYLGDEAIAVTDGDWSCRSETTAGACDLDMSIIDSEIYYIHKDHLGSAILLTDMDQNEVLRISYTPFGEATLTGSVEYNPRRPGQYQDNDFVYYNGYRYYEPSTGRYLQPEPLYQNPEAVQAYAVAGYPLNPYAYAANNPLRFVDPSGLYFDYSYLGWLDSLSARWALFWLRRNKDIGHLIDELDESPHPIYFQNIDKQDPLGGGTYPIKGCQGAFIKYDLWNGRRLLDDERIPKHLRIPMAQTGLEEYLAHELGHAYVIINGGLINGSVVDTNDVSLEWENSVRRPKGGKLRLDHDIKLP
jgi:RHS repeat-associated protein